MRLCSRAGLFFGIFVAAIQAASKEKANEVLVQGDTQFAVQPATGEHHQGLAVGTRVVIHGLRSAVVLNGREGAILGFDRTVGRYAVQVLGGPSMKIRPTNLWLLPKQQPGWQQPRPRVRLGPGALDSPDRAKSPSSGGQAHQGALVLVKGLVRAKTLNGQVGRIQSFDFNTGRYVVKLRDGVPRRIRPSNLFLLLGHRASWSPAPPAAVLQSRAGSTNNFGAAVGTVTLATQPEVARLSAAPQAVPATAAPTAAVNTSQAMAAAGPKQLSGGWQVGSRGRLQGLQMGASQLNGQIALIRGFDKVAGRYVIQLENGALKRVRGAHLAPLQAAAAPAAQALAQPMVSVQPNKPIALPRLSVCNAYTVSEPLQVFAQFRGRVRGGRNFIQVVRNLAYQTCTDLQALPAEAVALAFTAGKFQVGRMALSQTGPQHGLEVTVFRSDKNSLKASVHQNTVEMGDPGAYYLQVVNGYAGSRTLQLQVERGAYKQPLPMGKTYRLTRVEPIGLTLTDGSQELHLSFQPRHARTYCVVATGAEEGLRGEPRNLGLVAHEVGAWTTSEEARQEDRPQSPAAAIAAPSAPTDAAVSESVTRTEPRQITVGDRAAQLVQWLADASMWPR